MPSSRRAAHRIAAASAGAMLLRERRSRALVRKAVSDPIDLAVARVDSNPEHGHPLRNSALLALLLLASKDLAQKAERALVDARQAARKVGAERMRVELAHSGVRVPATDGSHRRLDDDLVHAHAAASSLGTQWLHAATAAALLAKRRGKPIARAVAATERTMGPRVDRTVATETARAYADEHSRALLDAIESDPALATELDVADPLPDDGFPSAPAAEDSALDAGGLAPGRVVRLWCAILDRRTCADCWDHNGEVAEVGSSFRDGAEPGDMHPRCRCVAVLVPLANVADYIESSAA